MSKQTPVICAEDLVALHRAHQLLENPSLAARMTSYIGSPIEAGLDKLPVNWSDKVNQVTHQALTKALETAVYTLKDLPGQQSSNRLHKAAVATAGGIGGLLGLAAMAIELPVSTTIILRSIADIARSEGESLEDVEARVAFIEVFALGGTAGSDDTAESGYFAMRTALARAVSSAAEHIAQKGITRQGAPALVNLISRIAERYSIQVSQKFAAQAIPAIGALGGAVINTLFIDHFQDVARGHFIVRRLEREYGVEVVRSAYIALPEPR